MPEALIWRYVNRQSPDCFVNLPTHQVQNIASHDCEMPGSVSTSVYNLLLFHQLVNLWNIEAPDGS